MTGGWRALLRLLAVQGTWNYERMLGVGMGYAAEPLLEDLKTVDPVRHGEAVVRSAEFFNCNPNLAGLALGATARAEYEAVPGAQIARLRTALCSPLGALGDELFWAGLVPALVGAGAGGRRAGRGLVGDRSASWSLYNLVRLGTAVWALRTGFDAGMRVGTAIGASWLPRAVARIGPVAGFAVGLAIPLVAGWYLRGFGWAGAIGALAVAGGRGGGVPVVRPLADERALRAARHGSPLLLPLGGPVIEREATIVNQEGLHARPAARIVRLASTLRRRYRAGEGRRGGERQEHHGRHDAGGRVRQLDHHPRQRPRRGAGGAGARRARGERVRGDVSMTRVAPRHRRLARRGLRAGVRRALGLPGGARPHGAARAGRGARCAGCAKRWTTS